MTIRTPLAGTSGSGITSLVSSFLFPNICLGCGNTTTRSVLPLCTSCEALLQQTQEPDVHHVLSGAGIDSNAIECTVLWFYHRGGPVPRLHRMIKYHGSWKLGVLLGKVLGERIRTQHMPTFSGDPDSFVLIPIPLHPIRHRDRGFNQAEAIAMGAASVLDLQMQPDTLQRLQYRTSQVGRSREDRLDSIRGAFGMNPRGRAPESVVLIDDVITTGATMSAAVQALQFGGVRRIRIAALALVPE